MKLIIVITILIIFSFVSVSEAAKLPDFSGSLSSNFNGVCCECVPFYICVNGTINTDGAGFLDLRIGGEKTTTPAPVTNVDVCPDVLNLCCLVPDADPSCSNNGPTHTKQPKTFISPPPESSCECIGYGECDPELVVSDGLGTTTIELSNGRMVSHSKCLHSLDVCCYLPDLLLENLTSLIDPTNDCECVDRALCGPDGHIQLHGVGVISVRLGPSIPPKVCPHDPNLICCLPPTSNLPTPVPVTTAVSQIDKNKVECECVEPILCGSDGHIKTDGAGILNLRIGPSKPPQVCPHDTSLVCCLPPKDTIELSTKHPVTSISTVDNGVCECVEPILCGPDGHIKTDGAGVLNLRLGPSNPPKICPYDTSKICCLPPKDDIEATTKDTVTSISTVDQNTCECVQPYLCGPDGRIRSDGASIINTRLGPSEPPKRCPHDPTLVCCLPQNPEVNITTTQQPYVPPPCGQRNTNGIGVRILGFSQGQTQFGEFPWVATLLKYDYVMGKKFPFFVGGASLIHRRIILTAAHKVVGVPVENLIVRLGEWDTASTKETHPFQEIKIKNIIVHPHYAAGPLFHDVALLILKYETREDFHINPICIAKSLDDVIPSSCVTNGWGVDAFRSENYQKIMKSVKLPLVNKGRCQNLLRRTRLSKYFQLHNSFICAGGEEGIDSCKGDGGGPLSCQTKNDPTQYLQVGITAWGIGCGEKDVPGVYVDVPVHYDWIMNHVNSLHPEKSLVDQSAKKGPLTREEKRKIRQERRRQRQQWRKNRRGNMR